MGESGRLLDTGLRTASHNVALARALLESRAAGESSSTLRFFRTTPAALVSAHQRVEDVFQLSHCHAQGIAVQRRITDGAAWYFDEAQLGWELTIDVAELGVPDMQNALRRFMHAAAAAVSAAGVAASVRGRGEMEIDGRRVARAGGVRHGPVLLLQGLLTLHADPARDARLLRLPACFDHEYWCRLLDQRTTGLDAVARVDFNTLRSRLIEAYESDLEISWREGELTLAEQERFDMALKAVEQPDWISWTATGLVTQTQGYAERIREARVLRAAVKYEAAIGALREIWFSGDFDIRPARIVYDLEAALADVPHATLDARVERFFAQRTAVLDGWQPADFSAVAKAACAPPLLAAQSGH